MILILEGPDGGGKTTLAKSMHGAVYHHEGLPPDSVNLTDYYLGLVAAARSRGEPCVFDRLAMSEIVYGPVLRGASRIDREGWQAFESGAAGMGAVTIICLPPWGTCLAAWSEKAARHGELVTDLDQFRRIYDHFLTLSTGRLRYDWTRR